MTEGRCEKVRDLLPERAAGVLGPEESGTLEEHLASCPECRRESELLEALRQARPEPPEGLEARIQGRVREDRVETGKAAGLPAPGGRAGRVPFFGGRRRIPSWALSAAALLVLGIGTSRLWMPGPREVLQDPIVVANQEPLPEAWLWDDGMIAGAPVFDGLSDEELEALLQELEG